MQTPTPHHQKPSLPWQGILLIIFNVLIASLLALYILLALFNLNLIGNLSSELGEIADLLRALGSIITLIIVGILVFQIFIIRGLFLGHKWVVDFLFVFQILSTFRSDSAIVLGLNVILLGLEWMCLKHPFYNQKKKLKEGETPKPPSATSPKPSPPSPHPQ